MTTKKQTAFRIDTELLEGLRAYQEREGVTIAEQVRRAIRAWLIEKDVIKADRKRASTRKRS
jgi:predicted DNA-binding protein